jgi:mRNA interferase HigB
LREFWEQHPRAKGPMSTWHAIVEEASFTNFASVRSTFNSADMAAGYVVFDVNSFRIIADIHYDAGRIYIRHVFTHGAYELWTQSMRGQRKGR